MNNRKEVTIYDIAKVLNLSASTVSRGLRGHSVIKKDTRRKITNTAVAMGYQQNAFARNLRKNRSNTIGVILPRLNSSFQSSVVAGIEKEVSKREYTLIISQSRESVEKEKTNISTMFSSRVDGLIISLASDTENLAHLDRFLKKRIPVVLYDRVKENPGCECIKVVIDNELAGYDAVTHLIEQDCKRILFLGGNLKSNVYNDRHRGYKRALAEHGLPFDQELTLEDTLDEGSGKRTVEKMLNMNTRPDGIFAVNDTSAVAIIYNLKELGIKVPEDVAVVGFNNVYISRVFHPSLTTVDYPGEEMGKIAASTLIELLDSDKPFIPRTIVLNHKLIIRDSSVRNQPPI
jgi:LacI family transcriptional regulator